MPASCTRGCARRSGCPARTAALEIDLDLLMSLAHEPQGPALSSYPVAKEDVALVVDAELPAATLAATLRAGAGDAAGVGAAVRRLHR